MKLESKTLKVTSKQKIHCGGRERTVRLGLKQLSRVIQVDASHKAQRITLTFGTQALDLERVRQELDWLGY